MAQLFSDTFSGGDASTLGANWTGDTGSTDWDVDTGTAEAQGSNSAGNWVTATSGYTATADVKVTATQISASGNGAVLARVTSLDNGSVFNIGYAVFVSSGGISIVRANGASRFDETQIGSTVGVTQVANGVIALEVSGSGTSTRIKAFYQGVETLNELDSGGGALNGPGRCGLANWASLGTTSRYDTFTIDDLAVGGAAPVRRSRMGLMGVS